MWLHGCHAMIVTIYVRKCHLENLNNRFQLFLLRRWGRIIPFLLKLMELLRRHLRNNSEGKSICSHYFRPPLEPIGLLYHFFVRLPNLSTPIPLPMMSRNFKYSSKIRSSEKIGIVRCIVFWLHYIVSPANVTLKSFNCPRVLLVWFCCSRL